MSLAHSTGLPFNPILLNSIALAAHNPLLAYSNLNHNLHSPLSMVERMKQNRFSPYTCPPSGLPHSPPIPPPTSLPHSLLPPSYNPTSKSAFQSVLPKPNRQSPPPSATPPSTSPGSHASSPSHTPSVPSPGHTPKPASHSDIRSIERMVKSLNGEGGGYSISHDGRRSLNIH